MAAIGNDHPDKRRKEKEGPRKNAGREKEKAITHRSPYAYRLEKTRTLARKSLPGFEGNSRIDGQDALLAQAHRSHAFIPACTSHVSHAATAIQIPVLLIILIYI